MGSGTEGFLGLRGLAGRTKGHAVAMEATGGCWRPPFYLLEDDANVISVNPADAKGLPGRKSDVTDSMWLAQLADCGLLKACKISSVATDIRAYPAGRCSKRSSPGTRPASPGPDG